MVKKWYSTKEVAEMLGYGQTEVTWLLTVNPCPDVRR
jgi:hypothetical protein